jgi:cytochrome c oxidase subunit II
VTTAKWTARDGGPGTIQREGNVAPSGTDRPQAGTALAGARRPRRRAPLVPALLSVGLLLLTATGCASEDLPTFAMPARDTTDRTPTILSLWQGSWIAAFSVGALVWGLILWAVIFYRRRRNETGLPAQTRYNVPIEVLYTVVPLIMIAVFFFFTARDEDRILQVSAHPDHEITVTGIQWSWQFTYESDGGPNTTLTGTPGRPPTLVLPKGESVKFKLHSDDVIHSFWVPAFLFKMDVIPGRENVFQITPTKIGTYAGKCAELCGQDHSRMLFNVRVVSPDAYDRYVAALKAETSK